MFISILISLFHFGFLLYRMLADNKIHKNYQASVFLFILLETLCFIYFIFSLKYISVARHFSSVQIMIVMIFTIEINIITEQSYQSQDGWTIVTALLNLLSINVSSKRELLLVCVMCSVYNLLRTYFWIESLWRYLRYNTYFILTFALMYSSTSLFLKNEREKF